MPSGLWLLFPKHLDLDIKTNLYEKKICIFIFAAFFGGVRDHGDPCTEKWFPA